MTFMSLSRCHQPQAATSFLRQGKSPGNEVILAEGGRLPYEKVRDARLRIRLNPLKEWACVKLDSRRLHNRKFQTIIQPMRFYLSEKFKTMH